MQTGEQIFTQGDEINFKDPSYQRNQFAKIKGDFLHT